MILLNQEQRLGRKAYLLMSARKVGTGLIILIIGLALLALAGTFKLVIPATIVNDAVIGVFLLAVIAIVMGLITARVEYDKYTFTFEEFGMKLRRGRMRIVEVTIPYRQMQDINIERGILHQMSSTSKVIISTASNEADEKKNETDIVLEPVAKDTAEEIRLMLMRKIGVQVVEGEKEADREFKSDSTAATI